MEKGSYRQMLVINIEEQFFLKKNKVKEIFVHSMVESFQTQKYIIIPLS